jgi:hypothetical protein
MGRGAWAADCLDSIHRGDLTLCRSEVGGEPGVIRMIYGGTHWPRWLMLQDSVQIKDQAFFDLVDQVDGPALVAPRPCMYLAVYERKVLDELDIPVITDGDREKAIQHECEFMDAYVAAANRLGFECPVLCPELTDANARGVEERHGRKNLVLDGQYLIKYKGTWR